MLGTNHEGDQPAHLTLMDDTVPEAVNWATYAGPEGRLVIYPVRLRNRLISAWLEAKLKNDVSYYIQFSTNIEMYIHNIKTNFVSPASCG